MVKKLIRLTLAGAWAFLALPSAATADALLSLERAVEAGRQLAGRGNVVAASESIRVALIYERSVTGRRYDVAPADAELLATFLSFVEPGIAARFGAGTAQARAEPRRRLVRALVEPGSMGERRLDGVPDDEFCRAVRDVSDLRPASIRHSLGLLLADRTPPSCLAHSLFFNTEIRAEDTAILRQLGGGGTPQTVMALVRQLVNIGRFAEALALAAHIRDGEQRNQVERAVVSARQLTSLKLQRPETSKAILDAILRRTGTEREIFGSLLAAQASAEFWLEHAAAIQGFLTTVPPDGDAAHLRDIWSRQVLARGGYVMAARVWAAAPSLMPAPEFLAAFFYLRDDVPEVTGPSDKQLGGISASLGRLATTARLSRLPPERVRDIAILFRALLDSYAGQSRPPRLTALDAGFLAAAAARVEAPGAPGALPR